ncbi:hypothetical protein B0H13DRAFT_1858553 [Mycena leptocephala]|nr:hypothetical protein B0H13DRAFT_1858553 [Mycena leptocephala]
MDNFWFGCANLCKSATIYQDKIFFVFFVTTLNPRAANHSMLVLFVQTRLCRFTSKAVHRLNLPQQERAEGLASRRLTVDRYGLVRLRLVQAEYVGWEERVARHRGKVKVAMFGNHYQICQWLCSTFGGYWTCPSSRMPLPLLLRIELDGNDDQSRYLGNTAYDIDFLATRDKTVPRGSLCTFKCCEAEIDPTPAKRGCVLPFLAQVFGRIDQQFFVGKLQIVRFGCPEQVSCRTKQEYHQQITTLAATLKAESAVLEGRVASDWFAMDTGSRYPFSEGCFYVIVSPTFRTMFHLNALVEMLVTLKRVDSIDSHTGKRLHTYTINGGSSWRLAESDMAVRDDLYQCDSPLFAVPSYRLGGSHSIAFAVYPTDFIPTREGSLARGSLFTYKSTRDPEVMPTAHRRGFLKKYEGALFGEIKGLQRLCVFVFDAPRYRSRRFSWASAPCHGLKPQYQQATSISGTLPSSKYQVHVVARYDAELNELIRELSDGMSMEFCVSIQRIDISDNGVTHERVGEFFPISCTEPEPNLQEYVLLASGSMSFITSFYAGTHIAQSNYPQDFAPVRYTSTKDRHGSVYVYRLLTRDCTIFPDSKRRQSLPSFTTVFTGCVQEIVYDHRKCPEDANLIHVKLGLPEDYNDAASKVVAAQEAFLKRISDINMVEARMTCVPLWGAPTAQYMDPTVVISIPKVKRIGMKMFKEGDDITVTARMKRVDRIYGDVCFLGLRSYEGSNAWLFESVLLQIRGARSKPYQQDEGNARTPDRLPIVKVVCPVAVTCSIRRAYYKQIAVLTQILDDDFDDLGEGHIMSWFRPDGMQISGSDEGTIYMIIDDGGEMKDQVLINELCAFWVTMHRTDRKGSDGCNHRNYLLKAEFFTWVPTVEGDQKKEGISGAFAIAIDNALLADASVERPRIPIRLYTYDPAGILGGVMGEMWGAHTAPITSALAMLRRTLCPHMASASPNQIPGCESRPRKNNPKFFRGRYTNTDPEPSGVERRRPLKGGAHAAERMRHRGRETVYTGVNANVCDQPGFGRFDATYNARLELMCLLSAVFAFWTMLSLLHGYGVDVLANAAYNRDFVAIRQRSLYNGSLYAFKKLPQHDNAGYYGSKGSLWNYVAVVFGQVQETFGDAMLLVDQTGGRVYVRLGCPVQPSCAIARLYQQQHSALQDILTEDQEHLGGTVSSSFFDRQSLNPNLVPLPGVFYVDAGRSESGVRSLRLHSNVVMKLTITRSDAADYKSGEMTRAYRLDALVYHSLSEESVAKRNLTDYRRPSSTFALAQYGKDYVATRERTHEDACLYTYKSTWDGLNYIPVTKRKNCLEQFSGRVFGTIREVLASEDETHLVVRIGRPSGVTCAVRDLYSKQSRRMRKIITEDAKDAPGTVGFSWFNRTRSEDCGGHNTSTNFYVVVRAHSRLAFGIYKTLLCAPGVIGKVAQFVVNLEREDRGAGEALHKTPFVPSMASPPMTDLTLRLAPETIARIFEDAVEPIAGAWLAVIKSRKNIALSELWSVIPLKRFISVPFIQRCLSHTGGAKLTLQIDTCVYSAIEDGRELLRVTSQSLDTYGADMLSVLNNVRKRVDNVEIEAENDYVLRFVLEKISQYDAFDLRLLKINIYHPLDPHTTEPPHMPMGRRPTHLTLRRSLPLWTAPDVYRSITKLVLKDIHENMDLRWSQLRLILCACVVLVDLYLADVTCLGHANGPSITLPPLERLAVLFSEEACVSFLVNLKSPSIRNFDISQQNYLPSMSLIPHISHLCGVAERAWLQINLADAEALALILRRFTVVETLNVRPCREAGKGSLIRLVEDEDFAWPQLSTVRVEGFLREKEARALFSGTFGKDLKVQGGFGHEGTFERTVLGPRDCFEWYVDTQGTVVSRIVVDDGQVRRYFHV